MSKRLLQAISELFSAVASLGLKPASGGYVYQPRVPKHLIKK